ncbi:MAG: PIN domain-containing protein [Alteromonadaceae bacterium TMED7]|uniref:PIN domain-containing protein n=1 Tax=Alteromonas sp. TaxID=232 RepID=UPI000B732227|nr:PIN domain-containing protein [Alteromonas sp.]MAI37097.1 PIN domain-containing protein [Alteromonas sp.]RPH16046.1 MAG: PIN domain-containing protein [Alteromonadaceae bacterium TMED7]|tara:strand:+ start:21193 stop:21759 length:567 start_codon:yes stop_codon:yes gene_type:complete
MRFTALLDANILYPAPLRDLFMRLAVSDIFAARWTERIHDEWMRNVLKNRQDLAREQLERTRNLMNSHVRDCLVEDFEQLEAGLQLPDEDDRHVLAAAIKCNAQVIVTFNLKDFPEGELNKWGIEAISPDDFVRFQLDLNPGLVCHVVKQHREALKNPPKTIAEYLDTLEANGLVITAAELRGFAENL